MQFSIVIPYYNHSVYIPYLINSLIKQASWIDNIVIVDDGSVDSVENGLSLINNVIIDKVVVLHQPNSGTAAAINRGVEVATCENIAILNSDDAFAPRKLARCADIFSKNEIDLIFGRVSFIDENNFLIDSRNDIAWYKAGLGAIKKYKYLANALVHENFAATSSNFVFKKRLFETVGGFNNYRYANDLDFLLRANFSGGVYFDAESVHVLYRYHNRNTIKEDVVATTREVEEIVAKVLVPNLKDENRNEFFLACKARGIGV